MEGYLEIAFTFRYNNTEGKASVVVEAEDLRKEVEENNLQQIEQLFQRMKSRCIRMLKEEQLDER